MHNKDTEQTLDAAAEENAQLQIDISWYLLKTSM